VPGSETTATATSEQVPATSLKSMTFFQHLEELRSTLIKMAVLTVVASAAAWFVSDRILAMLVPPDVGQVHYFGPTEGFMIRLKVSLVIGLLVAMPLLLLQIWSFVAPGLFRHERRLVLPVLISSTGLFYFGVAFAYVAVVPKMMGFFLSFSGQRLQPMINVTQYFVFVAKFCLAFGTVFQLPLVIVLLSWTGLVTPQQLWSKWRYGTMLIFLGAAWLTPPDAISQLMMAIPIVVLYVGSIGLSFLMYRRRRKRREKDS
jgi:sec-independent protein translocase protein TatC